MSRLFDYTHENHFKFGYHGGNGQQRLFWFLPPPGTESLDWEVDYGACTYKPTSFKEECYRAARLISENAPSTPNIMFSGGTESEIVVRSFRDQKLPFNVSIMKFKNNLNLHDISLAVEFCVHNDISHDIIELDIENFLNHEVYEYANRTQCCSPQLPTTMWLADQIDGLPILGSGEPYVKKEVSENYVPGESPYEPSVWYFQEKERIQSWYRHFMNQRRPAIPGFFQYTPELMYAFLVSPVVNELVNNKRIGKLSTVSTKNETYALAFPDLAPRSKLTGFEKISEFEEPVREKLLETHGVFNRIASFEYHSFVKRLWYG